MTYLIVEIFLFLLAAFGLGLLAGWLVWHRSGGTDTPTEAERKLVRSQSTVRDLERRVETLQANLNEARARADGRERDATPAPAVDKAEPSTEAIPSRVVTASAGAFPNTPPSPPSGPAAAAFASDESVAAPPEAPPTTDPEAAPAYDDLHRISGIGFETARQLADLGVTTFRQIAHFTDDDIERVGRHLNVFPDRVRREKWVAQAAALHRATYGTQP
ncbi:MAG: hypothetical protein AAF791_10980 [Bacteroidota bacterium]